MTSRESALWVDSEARPFSSEVEPRSNYFVSRVKKDFRGGLSTIGGIVTTVHRDLGDSALAVRLRSSAYVSGLDFGHLFANRTWEVSGTAVGSYISGSTPVLIAAQRSSVRFYQRPDASYLHVDSSARRLAGWAGTLNINKSAGKHWTGDLRTNAISPGYEINDLGFQNNSDRVTVSGGLNYDERIPGKHLRNWGAGLRPEFRTNFGGDITGKTLRGDVDVQLLNFTGARVNLSHDFEALDDRLTRGGPLSAAVPSTTISANLNSDSRKPLTWNLSASEKWDDAKGWSQSRGIRFGFRPTSWFSGELGPNYSRSRNAAQYLARVTDAFATNTFGARYIFSEIRQTTLSTQARLNWTMSPRLGLSVVAEPFIASGQYATPQELRAPRIFAFNVYGKDVGTARQDPDTRVFTVDPDGTGPAAAFTISDRSFNTRSMNATANVRWDWRDGSTFFLVWQHRRANPATFGSFSWNRDVHDLFASPSENTLMFKFNYWFNM